MHSEFPRGLFEWSDAAQRYGHTRVQRWLRNGQWTKVYRGVFASIDVPLDERRRIEAALMRAGAHLVAIAESAAVLHGFGVLNSETVHLAGSGEKTSRREPGLVLHGRKFSASDITTVHGIKTTTAARTVVDLACQRSRVDALAVVDAALRSGACDLAQLAAQLESQRRARGILQARSVIPLGDPDAESPMESRLRMRVIDALLPTPQLQWWVTDAMGRPLYRLDLAWPRERVALEYDGIHHLDRTRQRHDLRRRNHLIQNGWTVVWATDTDVYRDYRELVTRLRGLLGRARAA